MKKIIKNLFYLFFPILVGGVISFIIKDHIDYLSLNRPPLAPPKIVFPIAWTLIYLLMGLSYFLYKKRYNNEYVNIDFTYYIQLFVNALWSIIFFLWKWRFIAIVWILLLLFLVIDLTYKFYTKVKLSSYLFIPYILWVMFATYLTIGIFILN